MGTVSDITLAVWVTFKLATITTAILLLLGMPLACWLANMNSRLRPVLGALVLPPTVLGFYLLLLFSPAYLPGKAWLSLTGTMLAFSFEGLVVGDLFHALCCATVAACF